jgi:quercetin dioxygenase-like cupin family protein
MIMELQPVSPTTKAPASNVTSDVHVNPIYRGEEPSRMIVSLVRFTPGARTNWHSHAVGQTLYVTDGGDGTTWLGPVTHEQYAAANQS